MTNVQSRVATLALVVALLGCGQSGKQESPTPTEPDKPVEVNPLGIPKPLVNDGLKLLGYPFDKQVEYKVQGFPAPGETSDQEAIPSFDKDKNVLTMSYSGAVTMPSEAYELREDGIYGVSLGGNAIEPPMKALPGKVNIGDSWPNKGKIQQGGVTLDLVVKVVAREKVKVPAGEFDATVLSETGTITGSGVQLKVVGKGWYVDGIGAVKRTVSQTDKAGKTSNFTIEAVAIK
jgi:hypothetical protein